jgi:hypothetical protein
VRCDAPLPWLTQHPGRVLRYHRRGLLEGCAWCPREGTLAPALSDLMVVQLRVLNRY